ncbi:MAG: ISAs1 family transposase [Gammaproteobacteria bacterium]|nr:ISAs1 family transposase [Gammaproteobacteria bacterium]
MGDLFARLSSHEFEICFLSWVNSLVKVSGGDIIPIDGKTVRRSHNRSEGRAAIHVISAWSSRNQVVLGQHKVDDKSNEITAIPELLKWKGLQSIAMVESKREVNGNVSIEKRYYISSLQPDAEIIGTAIRQHWSIENQLHWCLDITFREDECRVREGNAAGNFSIIRHIALNLLKQETTAKVGLKIKRSKAGWSHQYLAKILEGAQL